MRKLLLLLISLGIFGILGYLGYRQISKPVLITVTETVAPVLKPTITIKTENEKFINEATVSAQTAYEALQILTNQQQVTIKSKQYDFGVFVEGIGGVENTKEKSWIYFVNGKSPEVAADKANLKEGDKVEWKYIKPNF